MVFSPFRIAITSLGEERANLSVFRTFVRFVLVWICRFPLPLVVWEGLRFVIVALTGLPMHIKFYSSHLLFFFLKIDILTFFPFKMNVNYVEICKVGNLEADFQQVSYSVFL